MNLLSPLLLTIMTSPLVAADTPAPGKQVGITFQSSTDSSRALKSLLFLPRGYGDEQQTWPLLIFLHGAGECGDDLDLVKRHGPPKLVEQRPDDFPFLVASPQAPAGEEPFVDRWDARLLSQWLDHLLKEYAIDADRVYLTGLSMGGFGALRWAAREPQRFAAVVPVCGGGWEYYGERLKGMPLWFFHGDQDDVVPVGFSQRLAEAIRVAGGNPQVMIYEGVGHDSWTATYDNPKVYQWLLSHHRKEKE